jgi:glycosyltransferase involved in cell wall biosynthesis
MEAGDQRVTKAPRICIMTTSAISLDVFDDTIIEHFLANGWHVVGLCSPDPQSAVENIRRRGITVVTMPFTRQPAPLQDLWCLIRLWGFLLRNRFDVVHVGTPKASLLGSLAARLSLHRAVIWCVHGRAYECRRGWKRKAFVLLDKIIAGCACTIWPVSHSLKESMCKEGIGRPEQYVVLGQGSCKRLKGDWYSRSAVPAPVVAEFRQRLNLSSSQKLLLFVGRILEDKGINELVQAFLRLSDRYPDWHLVLVGGVERVGHILPAVEQALDSNPKIHMAGQVPDPRPAYAASDILVLPTYREGFPNVPLEAAAMELPIIATDAIGSRDSLRDGHNGLIVQARDVAALEGAMDRLMGDAALRAEMGRNGCRWVRENFCSDRIEQELLALCNKIKDQGR